MKISKHKKTYAKANYRIYILVFFVFAAAGAILFRLYNLQVTAHAYYEELASNQHKIYEDLVPKRGEIFAKDGSGYYPVAVNRELSLVYAVQCSHTIQSTVSDTSRHWWNRVRRIQTS